MLRRNFARWVFSGLALATGLTGFAPAWAADQAAVNPADRPNILFVVADDLGWADVGYHGGQNKTPNIDHLASTGLVLDQHYVAPVCSPTRCALMTGRYWSRFGITKPEARRAMAFDTVTLAVAMKSMGYDTALCGKWHLGSKPEWGPNHYGFDHSYGSLGGGCGPFDHHYKRGPYVNTWHRDNDLITEEGHVTDLLAAEAIRWLESRSNDRPFFLYVPFTAVHIPIKEPKQWMDANPHITDPGQRLFAAVTTHMDDALGRILACLDRTGKRENTLVVFISDNGGATGVANADGKYPNPSQYESVRCGGVNVPLRGRKGELYEGGIRVPAIVHWPSRLKTGVMTSPMHVSDWMPTLCALVGYQPTQDLKWDGRNVWPLLEGQKPEEPRTLYWLGPNSRSMAVRSGDWKLILSSGGGSKGDKKDHKADKKADKADKKAKKAEKANFNNVELFDLANDPYEKVNLAEKFPERVEELKKLMKEQAARDNDALVPDETNGKGEDSPDSDINS